MSNPIITRLGLTQFWYKYWYSDTKYSLNVKYDKLFTYLLHIYFTYGLDQKNNFFLNEYWYKNKWFKTRILKQKVTQNKIFTNNIFFRCKLFEDKVTSIKNNYILRNTTAEYFTLKLWVFKYNNWIIYIINWFKPQKKTKPNKYLNNLNSSNLLHKKTSKNFYTKRSKLLLIWIFKQFKLKKLYYEF